MERRRERRPRTMCVHLRRVGRVVVVTFGTTIESQAAFDGFLCAWEALYAEGGHYEMVFDMRALGWAEPRYCTQLAAFVAHLKADLPPLLLRSVIVVHGSAMRALLWLTFRLQAPIAPVHVLCRHDTKLMARAVAGDVATVAAHVPPYEA
jgi:hypothetical protein